MPLAAAPQLGDDVVQVLVLGDERVDVGVRRAAATASASSLTPQVFTCTPKRSSASVLSPSVTATKRMLSPKRASFRRTGGGPAGRCAHPRADAAR